jgi:hypothetical protein
MKADRKQILRDYRDRKTPAGAFAVRCETTGESWVGTTPDLSTRKNGVWFSLRLGSHPNRALQAVWTAQGEDAFSFIVLEELPDEDRSAYELANRLKELDAGWRERLGAGKVTG